jgi:DNA-binding Lrp family transcriptional regulator
MDSIDKKLLNKVQREFPVVARPYEAMAQALGITEQEVCDRLDVLVKQKIIRKISASIAPRTIGYTTTLVAASVRDEKLEEVATSVNAYPEVTHNYGREHDFNLWFTIVGRDRDEIKRICNEIAALEGVVQLMELPATHLFKLDVFFGFCGEEEPA